MNSSKLKVAYREDDLLTIKQAAEEFSVSETTLRAIIAAHNLEPVEQAQDTQAGRQPARYKFAKILEVFWASQEQKQIAKLEQRAKVTVVRTTLEELCDADLEDTSADDDLDGILMMILQSKYKRLREAKVARVKLEAKLAQTELELNMTKADLRDRQVELNQMADWKTLGEVNKEHRLGLSSAKLSAVSSKCGRDESIPRYNGSAKTDWNIYRYPVEVILPILREAAAEEEALYGSRQTFYEE